MTADILNLRKARKTAARKADDKKAEANRVKFGEPKAPKVARKAEAERAKAAHEAGRIVALKPNRPANEAAE